MTTAKTPVTPNYSSDNGSVYPANIDQGMAANSIIANQFQPHQSATGSPEAADMSITIEAGTIFTGLTYISKAQQVTSLSPADFIAPVTNPRVDRVAIDITTGDYVIITGTEGASPAAPAYSANHYPLCQINFSTVSPVITQITNDMITDERPIQHRPLKPSFSVHLNGSDQANITGADKILWTTEDFDTNSDFDNSTNYRFTPTVAGKYLFNATVFFQLVTVGDSCRVYLYKNGSLVKAGYGYVINTAGYVERVTAVEDANGTTDYFEIYAENTARDTSKVNGAVGYTFWTGCKID